MTARAVIYARFSSDNQREESIDAQVRAAEDYAKRNNLQIVKVYVDKAKSATTDKRPQFQEMIAESGKDIFDVIIVHKLDRFSRDKYDSTMYKRKLKQNGIRLFSVTENLDGSPESVILESMLEGMAEYFSRNLAREVMKGMKENALQCKHTGGIPPLGYNVDPVTKKYVINEIEANAVKMIFQLYLDGYGYHRIIDELNSRCYKTKLGKPFGKNSIHDILANEKYSGTYIYNRTISKNMDGKRNNHGTRDEENIIRIPGGMPAIIEIEAFRQVREKMKKNKHQPGAYKAKETYLLSGLIVCGECLEREKREYSMMGNVKHAGRDKLKHVTYRCGNRERTKICDNKEIRREYIEDYVLAELEKNIFNEKAVPYLVKKINEYQKDSSTERDSDLARLTVVLADINVQIGNIVEAIATGFGAAVLASKLAELDEKKFTTETAIQIAKSKQTRVEVTEQQLRGLFTVFRKFVAERNISEIKKFIGNYLEKVIVYKDHVEVVFFLRINEGNELDPYHVNTRITRGKLMLVHGKVA